MATNLTAARNSALCAASQSITAAPVRPSRCPNRHLIAGQIDEPGVPRVNPHPPTGGRAALPAGLTAAGLVAAEDRRGRRLVELQVGVGDKGSVRRRPRHTVSVGDRGHRAGRIADRRTDRGAQPSSGARPRRDLLNGLGERAALAVILPPTRLGPPQPDRVLATGNVARRGGYLLFHRSRHHPTPWACRRRRLGDHHMHHPGAQTEPLDTHDSYSWQP